MKVKYYLTQSGRSPVEDFILSLPAETRLEIADYFVHAFRKKTQALPPREIDLILKRIKEI